MSHSAIDGRVMFGRFTGCEGVGRGGNDAKTVTTESPELLLKTPRSAAPAVTKFATDQQK
jgi:hypothetical protein